MFIFWNYIYDFFKQNKNLVCVWLLRNERTGLCVHRVARHDNAHFLLCGK